MCFTSYTSAKPANAVACIAPHREMYACMLMCTFRFSYVPLNLMRIFLHSMMMFMHLELLGSFYCGVAGREYKNADAFRGLWVVISRVIGSNKAVTRLN